MSNFDSLFPETPPILFTKNHFLILKKLTERKEGFYSQQKLGKLVGINKTTTSKVIKDLERLEWCIKTHSPGGNYLNVKISRKKEIECFLGQWDSLSKHILLRPHNITVGGLIENNQIGLAKAISKLSQKENLRLERSYMKNNTQYSIKSSHGTVVLYQHGKKIEFRIRGFVLPLKKEDLEYIKEYIEEGIEERTKKILEIITPILKNQKIEIKHSYILKKIHLGLIAKKNISKTLSMKKMIKESGLISDNSIYGCDEIEAKGKIDEVSCKISSFIYNLFDNKMELC